MTALPESPWGGLTTAALLVVALAASVADVRTRRIPNPITVGGTLVGLALAVLQGPPAFLQGLGGAGIGLAVGLAGFALGLLGGGDAKLLMAVGAIIGATRIPGALLVSAALGGVLALAYAMRKGVALPALLGAGQMIRRLVGYRGAGPAPVSVSTAVGGIPYGLAIAAGSVFWWFWGGAL